MFALFACLLKTGVYWFTGFWNYGMIFFHWLRWLLFLLLDMMNVEDDDEDDDDMK